MEIFFYAAVAIGCLVAVSDYRAGIGIALVLDCVRDPIRKLTPGEPTVMTYVVCFIWGAAFVNVFLSGDRGLRFVRWRFPWLERAVTVFLLGLVPGALLSLALYENGLLLAGLGGASYGAPLLGVALGAALAPEPRRLDQLLKLYVIVNCIALVGSLAEWFQWGWPALGGLQGFEWIRYSQDRVIDLISGFFRSPDIAGFHAANAMMVSVMLLLRRGAHRGQSRKINPLWVGTLLWCVLPLMLCGRRKMLIMPFVFIAAYLLYMQLAAKRKMGHILGYLLIIVLMVAVPLSVWRDEEALSDYEEFGKTTITDAVPRLQDNIGGGVVGTLRQSGVMGSGLGVATQGAQHFGGAARKGVWQEDGVSRLFKELGIPGVVMFAIAGLMVVGGCRVAIRQQKHAELEETQGLAFALVAANGASFVISHQHFSGDPANALWVLLFIGVFIGSLALGMRPLAGGQKGTTSQLP